MTGGGYAIGTAAADQFFSLYGDTDGDRDVDSQDAARFALSNRRRLGQAGYNAALDYDGDNDVDSQDAAQFGLQNRKRMLFQ